jgi:hypothetical protein
LQPRFDQHPPHAAGRAGDGNAQTGRRAHRASSGG